MDVVGIVKEHPIPIVVGVVILLLLMSRSGGSSGGGGNVAAFAAQANSLAAQTNVQISGINSANQIAMGAQATERYKVGQNAALARAGIASDMFEVMTGAASQQILSNSANTLKITQDVLARQANGDILASNERANTAKINGAIQLNADALSAQIRMNADDNNFKLNEIGAKTNGSIAVMQAGGVIQKDLLNINNAFTAANLPTIMQHEENMLKIGGKNQLSIVERQTQADNTRAQAAKNGSDWGIVGNFFNAIFGD
jgi:hypothetical protein